MEAVQHYFKTIERTENPQLIIDLPEGVDKAEVEVIIRPLHDKPVDEPKPSRYEIAQKFKGTMKGDGYQVDKYDVYDQLCRSGQFDINRVHEAGQNRFAGSSAQNAAG